MAGEDEEFTMMRIQTFKIRVTMHCDACGESLRRRLQPIEGVIDTSVDVQAQILTVRGTVDSSVLLDKLSRGGKHPQLCSSKKPANNRPNNQNPNQIPTQKPNANPAAAVPNANANRPPIPNANHGQSSNSNRSDHPNPNPGRNINPSTAIPNPNNNRARKKEKLDEIREEDEEEYYEDETDDEDDWEDVQSEIQAVQKQAAQRNGKQNQGKQSAKGNQNDEIERKITMAELAVDLKGKGRVDVPILGGNPIGVAGGGVASSSRGSGSSGASTSRGGGIQIGGPNNGAMPYLEGNPNSMGGGQMPAQVIPSSVMMMGKNGNPHLPRGNPQAFQSGPPMPPWTYYQSQSEYYYNPYPDPDPAPYSYYNTNNYGYYECLKPPPSNSDAPSSSDTTGCSIM